MDYNGLHMHNTIARIVLLLLIPAVGWGATYVKKISGTTYYDITATSCDSVTADDTSGDFQDAIAASASGATIHICAGSYIYTDIDADGSMLITSDGMTIEGDGDTTSIDMSGAAGATFSSNNYDNFTFQNFRLDGGGVAAYPLRILSGPSDSGVVGSITIVDGGTANLRILGGDDTVVRNCVFSGDAAKIVSIEASSTYPDTNGVYLYGNTVSGGTHGIYATSVVVDGSQRLQDFSAIGNTISGQLQFGLAVTGYVTGVDIVGNSISGITGIGQPFGRGIELYSSSDTYFVSNVLVDGNTIDDIADPTVGGTDGVGIGIDEHTDTVLAIRNIVKNCEGRGTAVFRATDVNMLSNLFYNNGTESIHASPGNVNISSSCSTVDVANNTILSGKIGVYVADSSSSVVVRNNIIRDATTYAMSYQTAANAVNDYNNITAGSGVSTLNNVTLGSNSNADNPQLTTGTYLPANTDLHHAGAKVDLLRGETDLHGNLRRYVMPTIGAVEAAFDTGSQFSSALFTSAWFAGDTSFSYSTLFEAAEESGPVGTAYVESGGDYYKLSNDDYYIVSE